MRRGGAGARGAAAAAAAAAVLLLGGRAALADVDATELLRAGALTAPRGAARSAFTTPSGGLSLLVRVEDETAARDAGLIPVAPGFAALRGGRERLAALADAHPEWHVAWSPPHRPLLDKAADWTLARQFRETTGGSGKGVIVGIVDTGVDPGHADLLDPGGRPRVAWLLDFSRAPAGRQPELEQAYGCRNAAGEECAIYSGADLEEILGNDVNGDEPRDGSGHGTHVASLAAGDGSANTTPKYVGVAPEATLVVARVTRSLSDAILDADIVAATRFVFERAEQAGMPAVVNLSLGSDFGPHDGSSALEQALGALVGPAHPGRAIVVAAGNSGSLYPELSAIYPGPFGIHTEVHVPPESSVRVPLLLPRTGLATASGRIYVWIGARPSDRLEVGLDDAGGEWIEPLEPGESGSFERDGGALRVTILNASRGPGSPLTATNGAVVVLDGEWPDGEAFAVRLQGHGTASAWVQSEGDADPTAATTAVFPRATAEGTINVPASSADLIAVGASVNRDSWRDRHGRKVAQVLDSGEQPVPDAIAEFSAAGPTQAGVIKPDLVAPGAFVVGAMASTADPERNGGLGIFGPAHCENGADCLAVDNFHAVAAGTSMAAPQVAGAVALLFERDPTLTAGEVRALLQAGARRPTGPAAVEQQIGPGALDLAGALAALEAEATERTPSAEQSWLTLSASYAHPDLDWVLSALVQLRDADGQLVDGFDPKRLAVTAKPATLLRPLARQAPGLWRLELACPAGSGGGVLSLAVTFDGEPVATREVPIAVDRWAADHGFSARGGCAIGGRTPGGWPALIALAALARRRRDRATAGRRTR